MKNETLIENNLQKFLNDAIAGNEKHVSHEAFITEEHHDEDYTDYGVTFSNTLTPNKSCCDLRVHEDGTIELLKGDEDFHEVEVENFWQWMWLNEFIDYEG